MSKNFKIEADGNVVAWAILGRLELEEVVDSIQAIQATISRAKNANGSLKIIVDNFAMSQEGATAFSQAVAEKWGELQKWFIANLSAEAGDQIAVIQGRVTTVMQMTRLGQQTGMDKLEKHFCEKTYAETKKKAYAHLGIESNSLIESVEKLVKA
ncbi:hypothetical protein [Tumebacillus flagellatus]|uniref:STAS domain-containing protein n=1 Tax=Tumebacillus flagellatus TaxID=1157490 RepID=A0A074LR52_9BACL|nr:hypothetical protein [Tumebacillus flagellatus]KEO82303.1 hypothetical protein EL26_16090 [Tumebacillus flagellatus]